MLRKRSFIREKWNKNKNIIDKKYVVKYVIFNVKYLIK
jgi:hypothetical protein